MARTKKNTPAYRAHQRKLAAAEAAKVVFAAARDRTASAEAAEAALMESEEAGDARDGDTAAMSDEEDEDRMSDAPQSAPAASSSAAAAPALVLPFAPLPPLSLDALPPSRAAPLASLAELLTWSAVSPANLLQQPAVGLERAVERSAPPNARRVLHCHDMAGGYGEDADSMQGAEGYGGYAFQHWSRIDIFVYFSHARVAPPPAMWITAAHRNGVKILGTIITEWAEGEQENIRLLDGLGADGQALGGVPAWQQYANKLVQLAVSRNFDGWFLNIEAKLPPTAVSEPAAAVAMEEEKMSDAAAPAVAPAAASSSAQNAYSLKLAAFLSYLRSAMHLARPGSLVIVYDSICASDGAVRHQSRLTEENQMFLDACDGLFTDYHWKELDPAKSAARAGDRKVAVFTGVDLHGRGSFGGGGLACTKALDVIASAQTSLALFAPAWSYEAEGRKERGPAAFDRCERRLWLGAKQWRQLEFPQDRLRSPADLSAWQVMVEGPGWTVKPRVEATDAAASAAGRFCAVTSGSSCRRQQKLDLFGRGAGLGLKEDRTKDDKFTLRLRTEYAANEVGAKYKLTVRLLAQDLSELRRVDIERRADDLDWHAVTHEVENVSSQLHSVVWEDGNDVDDDAAGAAPGGSLRIGDCAVYVAGEWPEHRPCIADTVPRRQMPFHAFAHSFSTGRGRIHAVEGTTHKRALHAPADSWYNMHLQDNFTIVADALLSGGVSRSSQKSEGETQSLSGRAQIVDKASGFDGSACLQLNLVWQRGSTQESRSDLEPISLSFDCFEFGAPASPPPAQEWTVSFVYQRPSREWSVALCLALDDGTSLLVEDDSAAAAASATRSKGKESRAYETVSAPVHLLAGRSVRKIQIVAQMTPSTESRESLGDIRIGRVSCTPAKAAQAAAAVEQSRAPIRFQRFAAAASASADAASWLFDWSSPAPSSSVTSWDVYFNSRWKARVVVPFFRVEALQPQDLLDSAADPASFTFHARANFVDAAESLDVARAHGIHLTFAKGQQLPLPNPTSVPRQTPRPLSKREIRQQKVLQRAQKRLQREIAERAAEAESKEDEEVEDNAEDDEDDSPKSEASDESEEGEDSDMSEPDSDDSSNAGREKAAAASKSRPSKSLKEQQADAAKAVDAIDVGPKWKEGSAYYHFVEQRRPLYIAEHPEATPIAVSNALQEEWNVLSIADKAPYRLGHKRKHEGEPAVKSQQSLKQKHKNAQRQAKHANQPQHLTAAQHAKNPGKSQTPFKLWQSQRQLELGYKPNQLLPQTVRNTLQAEWQQLDAATKESFVAIAVAAGQPVQSWSGKKDKSGGGGGGNAEPSAKSIRRKELKQAKARKKQKLEAKQLKNEATPEQKQKQQSKQEASSVANQRIVKAVAKHHAALAAAATTDKGASAMQDTESK